MSSVAAENLEDIINKFTHSRTGEKIYLDLSQERNVILRPLSSRGSISLGAFWVKLLQHPNNYPVYAHPYKKLYQAGHKFQLQLRIDGISINIDLVSGQILMKGDHIIDWFINKFPDIITGYSNPFEGAAKKLCQQYDEEDRLRLKYEKEKMYKKYMETWPSNVLEKAVNVMDAGNDKLDYESISADGYLNGDDLETHSHLADMLNEDDTMDQLQRLSKGRVIQGCVLYRLWKSTLNLWLADKEAKIFIITPYIDADRLTDICTIFLQHKLTACMDTMCIPISSLYGKFVEAKTIAAKRFPARDQVTLEYQLFSNVVYPFKDFTTSFIAVIKQGTASILQTNTNFDRKNFITSKCTTSEYMTVDEKTFYQNYLDPILL